MRAGTAVYRNLPDGGGSLGNVPFKRSQRGPDQTYASPDGKETVPDYDCAPGCPVAELDRQSGERPVSGAAKQGHTRNPGRVRDPGYVPTSWDIPGYGTTLHNDTGTASRFFPRFMYCAKADRAEREAGLGALPARTGAQAVERKEGSAGTQSPRAGAGRTADRVRNHHPCVKPVALMRWLCRLVTPPGGLVLDPFAGSGTTGVACSQEGFHFIGIEKEGEYVAIARARIQGDAPLFNTGGVG